MDVADGSRAFCAGACASTSRHRRSASSVRLSIVLREGTVTENSRRILLVQPPYGDYTYPYHSLSYVAAPLKAAGYEVDVIDLNIVWFRSVFTSAQLRAWSCELASSVDLLQSQASLSIGQQEEVVHALRCIADCNTLAPERAVEIFCSQEFYDFPRYLWARGQVRAFERLLTDLYTPYNYFSAFAVPPYEPDSQQVVSKALSQQRLIADVKQLLSERYHGRQYLFCGITVPFTTQLVPGMAVLNALRTLFPKAKLIAGGTAISDIYKYKESAEALAAFRELCDFFYVGEAETGIVRFADWCRGEEIALPGAAIDLTEPKPILERSNRDYVSLGGSSKGFTFHEWDSMPPDYTWIDWDMYLAPERRVNYSPARGCFWNQCTFCDYGLNSDSPTAPTRTMDPETCASHLSTLIASGVQRVYLAVDAIAPKFLGALADQLTSRQIHLRWSTQFFLTRQFTPELVTKLAYSGLCVASFGLESGSTSILEKMGKGKNRIEQDLLPAFHSFRESTIGLQPLFFYGFPGETDHDRNLTVELLTNNSDIFATISKGGSFTLLSGSIAAKDPQRFGVCNARRRFGENISGELQYDVENQDRCDREDSFKKFNDCLPHWNLWERPWAGGIDTLHTQLYVERFGRGIFHDLQQQYRYAEEPWASITVSSKFDLDHVMTNVMLHDALRCPSSLALVEEAGIPENIAEAVMACTENEEETKEYVMNFRQYREI